MGIRFQGQAICASGRITSPFHEIIEIQGATALPDTGGYGVDRVGPFRYREIVRFERATAEVIGSITYKRDKPEQEEDVVYHTLAKATVEKLNIGDVVTADRVVASVTARHPVKEGPTAIYITGTQFENLQIAGAPVSTTLATDTLNRLNTLPAAMKAFPQDQELQKLVSFFNAKDLASFAPRVRSQLNTPPTDGKLPQSRGFTNLSIVSSVAVERPPFEIYGNVIRVQGFGVITLGKMQMAETSRRITMIEVDLGCPVDGNTQNCCVDGGVIDW
jgi:hypothetical protein